MPELIFPPDMPEEMKAALTSQFQRHEMAVEDFQHTTAQLFDSLNAEQLLGLRALMYHLLSATDNPVVSHFSGIIVGLLHSKHNICMGCGNDHDKIMEETGMRKALGEEKPPTDGGDPFKPAVEVDAEVGTSAMLSSRQITLMEEYNLDDRRNEENGKLIDFICLGCGMIYSTIEDRMLKPAGIEGCSGCRQKAKFG